MDHLSDDLLDPTTGAVERPVEAAFHRQSALGAVAPTARWEWAVKQRAQLVLPVLDEAVRSPDVGGVRKKELLRVHLDPAAAHRLAPYLLVMHRPERTKDKTPKEHTKAKKRTQDGQSLRRRSLLSG